MSKIDREAFLGIETATIIKPGDRVLLTVDGRWDQRSVADAQKLITERFPDAVFTFVTGVDKVTIAPAGPADDA
jgi:hypothetical protein